MHSFHLHVPTSLHFGADRADAFLDEVAGLGRHAFLVIGGGSARRSGLVARVIAGLERRDVRATVFEGIEPNPETETIDRAAAEGRAAGVDVCVALGGGSVMDATKAIGALIHAGEDRLWPFVMGGEKAGRLKGSLPIAAVPTTAATASEVTPYAVISCRAEQGKSVLAHDFLKPRVSWLNPELTVGVPPHVTADGAADILSHVFENYLLGDDASPLADRASEAVIATVIETLPKVLRNPADLEGRGDLLWASTTALNGYPLAGRKPSDFPMHALEHALSGRRPELAHGRGLATLFPAYFRRLHEDGRGTMRLARLGRRIFGATGTDESAAWQWMADFERWLATNGLLQSLPSLGFTEADYGPVADYVLRVYGNGTTIDVAGPFGREDIVDLFRRTHVQVAPAPRDAAG